MKRRTAEQIEKAKERRQKMCALAKVISDMTDDQRLSFAQSKGLRTIEGHEFSTFNHCFLLTQNPNISVLGGFRQWKRAGRSVMKGQHGLALWCPIKPADKPEAGDLGDDEKSKMRFILGTVFDITQTRENDGSEPEPETNGNGYAHNGNGEVRRPRVSAETVTEGDFQAL